MSIFDHVKELTDKFKELDRHIKEVRNEIDRVVGAVKDEYIINNDFGELKLDLHKSFFAHGYKKNYISIQDLKKEIIEIGLNMVRSNDESK